VDWSGSLTKNASGLSAASRMTAAQIVATLLFAEQRRFGGRSYPSLLPVSGWTGTMAGRFHNPGISLRVWAKSGTLYYATSLAGFLYTNRGRRLAFAVYRTDPDARRAYDGQSLDKRSPQEEKKALEWLKENRDSINQRLETWAALY
jgi:D-alanyl-D-alanine carboxypeptidase/D-alanyl-D-alanine-endopeptidase (penicillin-binding protein 4)